ncbi:MAG: nucleoside-diphosphate kinase [Candidatus Colwellbacteria bacterium]|nr:nucleoside-diphosphate kinase [Candidatus Colwellbacteria bacterium]
MTKPNKKERTLVIIKPDGVQRSLIGEIIKRYEKSGLKLVGLKFIVADEELVSKHYLSNPDWIKNVGQKAIDAYAKVGKKHPAKNALEAGNKVYQSLKKYITSGPVVVMVWQGMNAVKIVRKITGGTEPLTSDVGTIRGDLTIDSYEIADVDSRAVRNLIHASGSVEEAEEEIKIWFKKGELINYRLVQEAILYDVNLDGILE